VEAYHVENFGCRASRSDGESIASGLRAKGLYEASSPDLAQVVVLNTCTVTAEADRSARAFLRRVQRRNPQARIVVTGCYAQRAPGEIAALSGVTAVVGNSHKGIVPLTALMPAGGAGPQVFVDPDFAHSELASLPFASGAHQTRPNLKVQDGCANRCSFCVIPTTRGPSRSIARATCLDYVRRFVDTGGQELVLSGINLGRWGRDFQSPERFPELVAAILAETALPRLRLSSIEPMDWSQELLALFRQYASGPHPRLAPHAHLPLQSGSDAVLRRMHRRYRPWHYAERVNSLRAALPDAAIGADVMVGFPGETNAQFEESYRLIASLPLTYLHLFPFSARPGTAAWDLHSQHPVPVKAAAERMAALRALGEEKARAFRNCFVGRTLSAVTLEGQSGHSPALSANFLKIELDSACPANRMVAAEITAATDSGTLIGRLFAVPNPRLPHRIEEKQGILSSYTAATPLLLEETHR
jgi:threonylcarbamoyladenosine tRNA methylthiotransferase MtaB